MARLMSAERSRMMSAKRTPPDPTGAKPTPAPPIAAPPPSTFHVLPSSTGAYGRGSGREVCVGSVRGPGARSFHGSYAEEIVPAALRGIAGVDDALVSPGELALAVQIVGEPPDVRVGVVEVQRVDVDLAVA